MKDTRVYMKFIYTKYIYVEHLVIICSDQMLIHIKMSVIISFKF
jgi:hypothetical protein